MNSPEIYKIIVFDDGNQKYEQYENKWIINNRWLGKCEIYNTLFPMIKINSISSWKLLKLL